MPNVRMLRLSRGLTLTELALLVGIPARTLADIEYGLRPLAPDSRCGLARINNLQPDMLEAGHPGQLDDPRVRPAQILGATLAAGIWLVGTLVLTTTPAAEQLSMAAPLPNTAAQTRTARLSLARPRPRGRALLPAADRNPPPREGAQQSWQHDEVALIDARPPAPQSTAVEHGQSDVAPAAAAAAPTETPAAPTEAPAAPIEAATAPAAAPTETPAAPTEAPTASAEA